MGNHHVTVDDPDEMFDEQEWTGTKIENVFTVDDFDEALEDGSVSTTKIHGVDADDPMVIPGGQNWMNLENTHHDAVEDPDGHPDWKYEPTRDILVAQLRSRLRIEAIKRNGKLL